MATQRWIAAQPSTPEEEQQNWSLRPTCLGEYVGQCDLIERLKITIAAAKQRKEAVGHILLHGPPGLGKTTLAHVIAAEMGTQAHVTSGPALTKGTDLVGALTRLKPHDVLFIDEIHRLPVAVEEFIYPAMEDLRIDVAIDSGMNARTVSLNLKPFTLIGATTRAGLLSAPLRSRFEITHHLRYYPAEELLAILRRSAGLMNVGAPQDCLLNLARRSRGTPRIANRLLRRVRDYAQVRAGGNFAIRTIDEALALEGVDALGLDDLDRSYLRALGTTYKGGPVGLEALAATMGDDAGTLEDVVEPFLLQIGFLARTRRGRQLTGDGAKYVGVPAPAEIVVNAPGETSAAGLFEA
ncbi:MAG TPA: Holliday junction branch migration DNA helicase RuvB [Phycisphaerales bacterium]|nr:Holliday junction branch migration DNA helicase RuvB [Phycisphaerales bacterium]